MVSDIAKNKKSLFQGLFGNLLFGLVLKPIMLGKLRENKEGCLKGIHASLVARGLIR
jgi:hypothetical protein